ncbi:SixA phosphatase family protein [Bailinhaonella thermotolerans]|uniref:Histidine phosphatase family protein n=1 Tax=Bailinhaonella thermotolerans TaxID=1070861 RepID=A0A3A3ZYH0_9ACTN|nr:histidine phosphatase family protein [Bailinhaonella thermotolerans]RJL20395.1 histidine phosphatase family protein [Bailinhaonella thermotolerans]
MGARTLVVLRHAQAADPPGTPDAERPLTGRGERDARDAGAALRGEKVVPDLVLCSPALRTRQTTALVLDGLGESPPVAYERALWDNDAEGVLDLLRLTGEETGTLLVVGHNPSMHQIVLDLTGGRETYDGFPPGAFAVIDVASGWESLAEGSLRVLRRP